ncbi:MAG: hypothetical protein R6X13_10830 [bacterium]
MRGFVRGLAIFATVAGGLALVRLADAVGKRELVRVAADVAVEESLALRRYEDTRQARNRLLVDEQFLNARIASLSRSEPYIVIDRARSRIGLAVQEKTLFEAPFRLRGPADADREFGQLPKATLSVLGKRTQTDWVRPDWLYRLQGLEPPADSAQRVVANAFGRGEVFLGGDLVIHGRVSDAVPPGALDHSYIELDDVPLRALVDAAKPGTLVLIH